MGWTEGTEVGALVGLRVGLYLGAFVGLRVGLTTSLSSNLRCVRGVTADSSLSSAAGDAWEVKRMTPRRTAARVDWNLIFDGVLINSECNTRK